MKFLIISDFPYVIEKSGYGNQIEFILNYLIDYFPENEYIFIPIGIELEKLGTLEPTYFKNLDLSKKIYYNKLKIYGIENKFNLFNDLIKLQKNINLTEKDKILFYCDLIYYDKYIFNNILPKKYYWFPCHTSFNDNYNDININYDIKLFKKTDDNILNILPIFDKIATFSNYGVNVLKSINYNPIFINHSIDNKKFYPLDKNKLRDLYNIDRNSFVCLMIGRNNDINDRKAFKENLEGFKLFCDFIKKDNIFLILHTINFTEDINLEKLCHDLNIDKNIIKVSNDLFNLSDEHINKLYNLADVLLCNSKMEGFGLTSVEAQFCETPVIVTDCTGLQDNVYYGIKTKPLKISNVINNINSYSIPDPKEISTALLKIYNNEITKINIPKINYDINYIF